jgi:hypothetical protein
VIVPRGVPGRLRVLVEAVGQAGRGDLARPARRHRAVEAGPGAEAGRVGRALLRGRSDLGRRSGLETRVVPQARVLRGARVGVRRAGIRRPGRTGRDATTAPGVRTAPSDRAILALAQRERTVRVEAPGRPDPAVTRRREAAARVVVLVRPGPTPGVAPLGRNAPTVHSLRTGHRGRRGPGGRTALVARTGHRVVARREREVRAGRRVRPAAATDVSRVESPVGALGVRRGRIGRSVPMDLLALTGPSARTGPSRARAIGAGATRAGLGPPAPTARNVRSVLAFRRARRFLRRSPARNSIATSGPSSAAWAPTARRPCPVIW